MKPPKQLSILLAILALAASSSAHAAPAMSSVSGAIYFGSACPSDSTRKYHEVCATERVDSKSPVTYFELLKLLYPKIQANGSAEGSKTPRKDYGGFSLDPNQPGASPLAPGAILYYQKITQGESVKTIILQESSGLLGYFQVLPETKLLDVVSVSQDMHVSLVPDKGLPIATRSGEFIFLTNNWHFNSSENFAIYNLFLAGKDQIEFVYDGPFLYGFAIPEKEDCRLWQELTPFNALPENQAGVPSLKMRVKQEVVCQGKTREMHKDAKSFEAKLSWDSAKGKYMGGSRELHRLNQCRMDGKLTCP